MKLLTVILLGIPTWIVRVYASIIVTVEAFKIKATFLILLCFLPFGIANICGHSHHGGVKYIKLVFMNSFYLFSILAVVYVAGAITDEASAASALDLGTMGGFTYFMNAFIARVIGPLVAIKAITTTKESLQKAFN